MTPGRPAVSIDAAVRAYTTLCRVYPPAFRDRFNHELEDDFRASGGRVVRGPVADAARTLRPTVPVS